VAVIFLTNKSRLLASSPVAVTPSYISNIQAAFLRIPKSFVQDDDVVDENFNCV
jgi:hypothetical protein